MADCLVRDGLVDSVAVSALGDWPYRVYTLLLIQADFAGRFDGRLEFIRSRLFPLSTARRIEDIRKALDEVEGKSLLIRYEYAGKPYLQLSKVTRRFNTETALYPWKDGSYVIDYVDLPKPGSREKTAWVKTSLFDPIGTPSESHHDPTANTVSVSVPVSGNDSRNSARAKNAEIPEELKSEEFAAAWADYLAHRAEGRSKLTPTAIRNLFLKMIPWGSVRATVALRESMSNGWTGVFEPKGKDNGKPSRVTAKAADYFPEDIKL